MAPVPAPTLPPSTGPSGSISAGSIAIFGAGPYLVGHHSQVEQDRRRHNRHPGRSRLVADALLFQVSDRARGCVQPESAPTAENESVHLVDRHRGTQEVGLPRPRRRAPHVHAAHSARLA